MTYTIEQIKAAYWAEFHAKGELWFSYLGTDEQNESHTQVNWELFANRLNATIKLPETKEPAALYVVHCGEIGYFQVFKSAADTAPAFTHNVENAFKYDDPDGWVMEFVVRELTKRGYTAVINEIVPISITLKEDANENNTA